MVRFFSFKEELPIMKIICEKDFLVEAVSNVARAACAKSPVPALEGILLKAQDGQLQLTGYDLELGHHHRGQNRAARPADPVSKNAAGHHSPHPGADGQHPLG